MTIAKVRIYGVTKEESSARCQVSAATCGVAGPRQTTALVVRLCLSLLCLSLLCFTNAQAQEFHEQNIQSWEKTHGQRCPEAATQTSGSHGFRREGESIDIPIIVGDCQPISFVMRWSNGRSNGSSLVVTFLDNENQPIHTRSLSGFLTGSFEFPFASIDQQPWFARGSMVAVPATVVIQARAPFAAPANISYTVTRRAPPLPSKSPTVLYPAALPNSRPVSATAPLIDDQVAMKLRIAEGRLLSEGQGSAFARTMRYKLKEVALPEPRDIEIHGRREKVAFAYRLTLADGELRSSQRDSTEQMAPLSRFGLIWLDDAPLPAFSLDPHEISTLIYDRSVLRDGAEVSVSNVDGSNMYSLVALKYRSHVQSAPTNNVKANYESTHQGSGAVAESSDRLEEGNYVVGIRRAVRVIGATRMALVQIELKTNRPFPLGDSALQLQIGRRFFLNELTGDHTGRTLILTLTEEMFAELKQGAEIAAFFGKPDRSGFAGRDVWYFGNLDKSVRR